jgi:HSP20 family protein
MPNVRYYNNTAPFWDFVANLEGQGFNHPAFGGTRENETNESNDNPWAQWPFQPFQHRGGRHGARGHRGPPSPPPVPEHEAQDPPISTPSEDNEAGPSEPRGPPPPFSEGYHPHHGHGPHHGRGGRRGRCGGRGGPWGGRGQFGPPAGVPPFMQDLAAMFNESLFGGNNNDEDETKAAAKSEDFKPEADVFDTEDSYVIHINLPGAKKEDVGVNWDAEKSELNVAGVIYRPGDEEFLKTLALDERKVGAFERKIRLGSRANPALVDVEGITAKLEDGVLRVTVPKMNGEFVEVKKVDVE